jgi:hypothetical protein
MIEYLPSKQKALSLNLSTVPTKIKEYKSIKQQSNKSWPISKQEVTNQMSLFTWPNLTFLLSWFGRLAYLQQ